MADFSQRSAPPTLAETQIRLLGSLGLGDSAEARAALAASDFLAARAQLDGEWFRGFVAERAWERPPDAAAVAQALDAALADARQPKELAPPLHTLRHRLMAGLVWRHALGFADFEETVARTSDMADAFIDAALQRIFQWEVERHGASLDEDGGEQGLVVIALGKLGGRELNLSSDVDLLFAYPGVGRTANGRSNQQFFVEVAQALIGALDTPTGQGGAFRVDTRLRPYGESGPLVWSFNALETYYADQGRDWERYALVKMRPCAGDLERGAELVEALAPFVYRRYLDFGAVAALREMQRRIDRERRGRAIQDNVKLGPGGIREVEFLAVTQQLIWGGRRPELRCQKLLDALPRLGQLGMVEAKEATDLAGAYRYLRNVEHSLQAIGDRQTHQLPDATLDQARLAWMMDEPDYDAFLQTLAAQRALVAAHFETALAPEAPAPDAAAAVWHGDSQAPDAWRPWLDRLRRARDKPSVGGAGRERLDRLMPLLIARLPDEPDAAEQALARVAPILEAVLRRSAYLALLIENPSALDALLRLASQSKWIAAQVARHPVLFDELLPQQLGGPPSRAELVRDLDGWLARAEPGDGGRVLDVLREFRDSHLFRAAAAEMAGHLPLMRVSDYLTYLAEALLDGALAQVWREVFDAGLPARFVVVGYGKLGGLELGPGSDLDLVFLHDFPTAEHGALHRLVRRFLHALTVTTAHGQLYEVDMRLRPSGRAGAMVSSMDGFARYQQEDAWTWERQALVRARVVAGDTALGRRFDETRHAALTAPRDKERLKEEIVAMRRRIADAASEGPDLKRAPGGIVDVEFIVQYLVLAWANEHEALCEHTDNVRILETAARLGLIDSTEAQALTEAYLGLRSEWHRTALDLPDPDRAASLLALYRNDIAHTWQRLFGV